MADDAPALSTSFLEADRRQRVLHSKIGCILALVLMPAGALLDWFVYPDNFTELLLARLACDVAVLGVVGLLFTRLGARHIRVIGIAWALLPGAAISWMIFYTEGVASPYYAGLNLVIIAVSLLMPWTLAEVLATCGITLLFYLLACAGHSFETGVPLAQIDTGVLFNNVYFIVLTAVICATAAFFLSKLRFQDYRLRHTLAGRNEELNESYRKLAELDRLKSQFFANVSHELRTPLTLIISPLDDLLRGGGTGNPQTDEILGIARENGLRLLRLINELLDLIKLDEKGAEIKPRNENLTVLVPGIISSAAHLARAKSQNLSVQTPPDALIARVDPVAIEKVLLNLFTNAVKFTPVGGRITVTVSAEGGGARIDVADTGIGIAEVDLPRIFDRFAQLDSTSTRKYSGIGIGLALARELVEAHQGTLTAQSAVGRGTTMTVQLPLAEATEPEVAAAPSASDSIAEVHRAARRAVSLTGDVEVSDRIDGEGEHLVLVVEDEPDMRGFVSRLLARDYRVAQAATGTSGLDVARRLKPVVCILDLMLPGMDGLDLCASLRATPGLEGVKIILLTARTDEQSKLTALQRGANDFLTKPFSSLELRTRVANLVRATELEDQLRRTNDELRQTLSTLRETEEQLIRSEKINAVGTLAAGLLHEIFNPLNFTLAAVQMAIMDAEGNAALTDSLNDIEMGMKRIRDIVGDMRTFAHPERHLKARPFKLADAVAAAQRLVQAQLTNCKVAVDVDEGLIAQGSEGQVMQVLVNLLTNAGKATAGKPEPSVEVTAGRHGERVWFKVRDNGAGIPKDQLNKLFDPFYTTREPGEGMGLGLTICQTIVRNHGGTISIDSVAGEWTEATVELPSYTAGSEEHAHTSGLS